MNYRKRDFHMSDIKTQIEQVWNVELEILDVIHEVCITHNLRYTLAYGTLIGAVRHGGFIPWDDDIDLIMPRDDYEKLLTIWDKATSEDYILQNIRITPGYTHSFSKIRKNNTTFLQDMSEAKAAYHKGIFVDIFPADCVAEKKLPNAIQYIACAVNLLYTRGYTSGSGGVIGAVERILLALPKGIHPVLREFSEKVIRKWNGNGKLRWFVPSTIEYAKHYYPANLFDNMTTIEFNKKRYSCVEDPDSFLRADYGDYMQLPPEQERTWKHHPVLIDINHNYEDILKLKEQEWEIND